MQQNDDTRSSRSAFAAIVANAHYESYCHSRPVTKESALPHPAGCVEALPLSSSSSTLRHANDQRAIPTSPSGVDCEKAQEMPQIECQFSIKPSASRVYVVYDSRRRICLFGHRTVQIKLNRILWKDSLADIGTGAAEQPYDRKVRAELLV